MTLKIDELFAFLAEDEKGNEGLAATLTSSGWIPMVAADYKRVDQLRSVAQEMVKVTGQPIRLIRFSVREELEEINAPEGT